MAIPAGVKAAIRVLVADSNQTKSELLCSALRRQPGLSIVSCKASRDELLDTLQTSKPDVILLGEGHFPACLYDLIRDIKTSCCEVAIVLLLDSYDRELVVNSLRAGARGLFCQADQSFKSLCKCIHVVHQGQIWTNTEQMTYLVEALVDAPPMKITGARGEALLTSRENQVVALVAEGLGNRAVAKRLAITENTVKKSLLHIFDKLGVSNRVELVLYAMSRRQTQHSTEATHSEVTPAPPNNSRHDCESQIHGFRHPATAVLVATGAA